MENEVKGSLERRKKPMVASNRLFTIGHSNTELPVFLGMLRQFGITLLVDVRSRPTSYRNSLFRAAETSFIEPASES